MVCSTLKEFEGLALISSQNSIGKKSEFILAYLFSQCVPYVSYMLLANDASNHPDCSQMKTGGGGGVESNPPLVGGGQEVILTLIQGGATLF